MRKVRVEQMALFSVPRNRPERNAKKAKKEKSKSALKSARRRWRVTYKLRKHAVAISTNHKTIIMSQLPIDHPVKGWVNELCEKGYVIQLIIN